MKRAGMLMAFVAGIGASVVPGVADLRRSGLNVRIQKKRDPEAEAAAQAKRDRKAAKRSKK